jgi:hypothetical protein
LRGGKYVLVVPGIRRIGHVNVVCMHVKTVLMGRRAMGERVIGMVNGSWVFEACGGMETLSLTRPAHYHSNITSYSWSVRKGAPETGGGGRRGCRGSNIPHSLVPPPLQQRETGQKGPSLCHHPSNSNSY